MTINQLKRLVALSLFCISISFLVFNCEKEDDIFTTKQQTTATKNYIAPHIVYSDDITSNPKLTQTLQHLKQLNCKPKIKASTTLGNKLVYSEALNITIDDESAMYLENTDGSYHSYTFQAIDHEHPYGVQNIVLSLMPNGTYREVLVRYEVEGNEEIAFRNGESIDLTNKVSYAVLENGSFSSTVLSKVTTMDQCITITADQAGQVCKGEDAHTWDERNLCRHYPGADGPTPSVPFSVDINYACIDALVVEGGGDPAPSGSVPTQTNNGSVNDGSVTTVPYVSPAELARRAAFVSVLSEENRTWLNAQPDDVKNHLFNYLESQYTPSSEGNLDPTSNSDSFYSQEAVDFTIELIDIIKEDAIVDSNALGFLLEAKKQNKMYSALNTDFFISVSQYLSFSVSEINTLTDPIYIQFRIRCAVQRALHPDWSDLQIYHEVTKDFVHLFLDILGLVPAFGEPADIINGVIYTLEGDSLNATLSYSASLPFAGWLSTGTKWSIKVVNQTTQGMIGLVWKVDVNGLITFGNRNNLKHIIGTAGTDQHAHHIIPWAKSDLDLIQKAANSTGHFNMNSVMNGIGLLPGQHLTGHPTYSLKIQDILEELHLANPNISNDDAFDLIADFTNYLKELIQNNPNLNLGQIAELIQYP